MPESLVTLSKKIAKKLVSEWKNGLKTRPKEKPLLTKSCWEKTLEKGIDDMKGKVALVSLNYLLLEQGDRGTERMEIESQPGCGDTAGAE